jgi:hypothetical protein
MSVKVLGFNAIHSVIKKVFHKGPFTNLWGLSKMVYFIFGYFSAKHLAHL